MGFPPPRFIFFLSFLFAFIHIILLSLWWWWWVLTISQHRCFSLRLFSTRILIQKGKKKYKKYRYSPSWRVWVVLLLSLSLVAASTARLVAVSIVHHQWAGVLVLVNLCVDHSLLDIPMIVKGNRGNQKRVSLLIIISI